MTDNVKKRLEEAIADPVNQTDYYKRTMMVIQALKERGKHAEADELFLQLKRTINTEAKWEKR
ncbi:MAG: hypothetical protein ACRCX4_09305 [Bacteroidales bacterium]